MDGIALKGPAVAEAYRAELRRRLGSRVTFEPTTVDGRLRYHYQGERGEVSLPWLEGEALAGPAAIRRQAAVAVAGLMGKRLDEVDAEVFDAVMDRSMERLETLKERDQDVAPPKKRELPEELAGLEKELVVGAPEQGAPEEEKKPGPIELESRKARRRA